LASLVLAKWASSNNYRGCEESKDPDGTTNICVHWLANIQLVDLRTIAGPALPRTITVTAEVHGDPRPDVLVVAAVRPEADGYQMVIVDYVSASAKETCIEVGAVRGLKITLPNDAVRRGGTYCVQVPTTSNR